MSPNKYAFKAPYDKAEMIRGIDMDNTLQDLKYSENCLAFYSPYGGLPSLAVFTALNKKTFSMMVVLMCEFKSIFRFMKLAVATAERLIKKGVDKRKVEFQKTVEDFIENTIQFEVPQGKEA